MSLCGSFPTCATVLIVVKPVACIACIAALAAAEQSAVPRFADPLRRAKLEASLPEVDKVFEKFMQQRGIPGLAFGVVIDGEIAYLKGLGVRDRASREPVTSDTVFRIASMTKSFTALAILKLRDGGKLSLEDSVSKWIPEFARFNYPTRDTAPIRIRQLLSHAAGFPEDNPWGDRQLDTSDETLTAWLHQGLPFSTPPDTAYEYSNYGFALLGRIVSKVSGVPYREYLEKEILAPLGMRASTLDVNAVPAGLRATGYGKSGEEYTEEPALGHGAFGSMGGLLTSANDLGRYVAYQMSAWPPRDDEDTGPVRRSSMREMQHLWRPGSFSADRISPDAPLRVNTGGYGYGLSVSRDCRFNQIVGHGGGLPGFGSYMLWLPEYGLGLFAMTNLTYAGPAAPIQDALDLFRKTGALRPRSLPPSPDLLAMRDAIAGIWDKWDDSKLAAIAASNLALDRSFSARRKEVERIKSDLGICHPTGGIEPENLLRGKFRMSCERGLLEVYFTLAPTMPPKVQSLRFGTIKPLNGTMKTLAEGIASAIESPSEERVATVADASLDAVKLRRQLDVIRGSYGRCRVGEALEGDGATEARVLLECDRGQLELRYRARGIGKLASASFVRPQGVECVP